MAIQTTYPDTIARGLLGAIADQQLWYNFVSRAVETVAGIPFARAVKRGTGDYTIDVTTGGDTAADIIGFTVREQSTDPASPDSFAQYDDARVINKGVFWAAAAIAVNGGETVWVDVTDGTLYNVTGVNRVELTNAIWQDTIAAPGLSRISLS